MPGQINMPRDFNLTFADGRIARLHAGLNNVADEVLEHPYFSQHATHLVVLGGAAAPELVKPEPVQPVEPTGNTWTLRAPPDSPAGATDVAGRPLPAVPTRAPAPADNAARVVPPKKD
jgi:hypothetical protein